MKTNLLFLIALLTLINKCFGQNLTLDVQNLRDPFVIRNVKTSLSVSDSVTTSDGTTTESGFDTHGGYQVMTTAVTVMPKVPITSKKWNYRLEVAKMDDPDFENVITSSISRGAFIISTASITDSLSNVELPAGKYLLRWAFVTEDSSKTIYAQIGGFEVIKTSNFTGWTKSKKPASITRNEGVLNAPRSGVTKVKKINYHYIYFKKMLRNLFQKSDLEKKKGSKSNSGKGLKCPKFK